MRVITSRAGRLARAHRGGRSARALPRRVIIASTKGAFTGGPPPAALAISSAVVR
jgi:hypothetical protein